MHVAEPEPRGALGAPNSSNITDARESTFEFPHLRIWIISGTTATGATAREESVRGRAFDAMIERGTVFLAEDAAYAESHARIMPATPHTIRASTS